jgi:murein tripeptide amidase MpaA
MTFLNVIEIESALTALASNYSNVTQLITLPFMTAEGRQSHALRIGSGSCPTNTILFISGAHAREWGGPDICINFAADLLEAWSLGTGLTYGGTSFTSGQIQSIINDLEVIVFPDINPDGRHYSQTTVPMWRKNRNPASSGGQASKIGIDVNRNYDFLWNFPVSFAPAAQGAGVLASNDPASDFFHGTAAFSEAESKNVRWLFEQYPRISWFIDIHSYGGDILHAWGDDENQSTQTGMNFTNPTWDGKRGVKGDAYGEYISALELSQSQATANAMSAAIGGVHGQPYAVAPAFLLPGWTTYPTSGSSEDWATSRYFADPTKHRCRGYCIEFNKVHTFFPTWAEMEPMILDIDAGLINFCLGAVSPYPYVFSPCWWRQHQYEIWHRVFPPELWGPYGPWGRIPEEFESAVSTIVNPIIHAIDQLMGKGSR